MSDATKLLPCPFCGGEAELIDMTDALEAEYWVAHQCPSGASVETYSYETAKEAIEAWNTRAAMEFDNWFYLPKPKEQIVEVTETTHAWDGAKVKTDVFYRVQEQAVINWAKELDEYIIKRICEVWNTRVERTCHNLRQHGYKYLECSLCGEKSYQGDEVFDYCPNCGAKVVGE